MKISNIIFALAIGSLIIVTSCREANTKTETTEEHGHEHDADGNHKEDKVVYEYTIRAIRHVRSSAEGNCLVINVFHPHDGTIEFILPMKVVYEKSELRNNIAFKKNNENIEPLFN